jgi:hypothetical protein
MDGAPSERTRRIKANQSKLKKRTKRTGKREWQECADASSDAGSGHAAGSSGRQRLQENGSR